MTTVIFLIVLDWLEYLSKGSYNTFNLFLS